MSSLLFAWVLIFLVEQQQLAVMLATKEECQRYGSDGKPSDTQRRQNVYCRHLAPL